MREAPKASIITWLIVAISVAACSTLDLGAPKTAAKNFAQGISNAIAPPPDSMITEMREYIVGLGDGLVVTLKGSGARLGVATVSDAGTATLPRVGLAHVEGLTLNDIAALIEAGNTGGVDVSLSSPPDVYVVGAVNRPGAVPYQPGMTLGGLMTAAGPNYKTDMRNVWIKPRHAASESKVDLDPALPILPGDVVRLEERYF